MTTGKMPGKGQPKGFVGNPVGKNQYVEKAGEGERTKRFSVRVTPDMDEAIRKDAEAKGIKLTEWVEDAFEKKLRGREDSSVLEENQEIVFEAIALSLDIKRAALSRERKKKKPDQSLIEKWERQIEQLERLTALLRLDQP